MIFHGRVIDGKIKFDMPSYVTRYVGSLDNNKRVSIDIKNFHKTRSGLQNSYYHAVVVATLHQFLKELGWTKEDVHNAIKEKFLSEYDETTGLKKIGSTTKLNTEEFGLFIEEVCAWANMEMGIYVPAPEKEVK